MMRGAPRRSASSSLQQHVLGEHAALRQRALDHQQQVIGIDRLGQEVHRPFLHRRHRVLDAAVGGHHDDRQFRVELLGGAQHAEAVAVGQLEIGQHDGGPRLAHLLDGLGLVARFDHGVALRFERMAQHGAQRVLVLDEENRGRRHRDAERGAQRSQPGGTPLLRASSWRSATALVCCTISFFTRSSSVERLLAIGGHDRSAVPDRRGPRNLRSGR